jgi:hypothetical protein
MVAFQLVIISNPDSIGTDESSPHSKKQFSLKTSADAGITAHLPLVLQEKKKNLAPNRSKTETPPLTFLQTGLSGLRTYRPAERPFCFHELMSRLKSHLVMRRRAFQGGSTWAPPEVEGMDDRKKRGFCLKKINGMCFEVTIADKSIGASDEMRTSNC